MPTLPQHPVLASEQLESERAVLVAAADYYSCDVDDLAPRACVRPISEIPRQSVEWLWPGKIPLGQVTILAGDPGVGKSLVLADVAARVTRGGAWPGEPPDTLHPAGRVLFVAPEDEIARLVHPRLDAGFARL